MTVETVCEYVTCYKHLLMNSATLRSDKSLWIVLISLVPTPCMPSSVVRASGNGTAGTAMDIPVFEGEKNGVAWILNHVCVME